MPCPKPVVFPKFLASCSHLPKKVRGETIDQTAMHFILLMLENSVIALNLIMCK